MKILLIQGGFGAGGAEKIVALIAAHRDKLGDDVHVAGMTLAEDGSYFAYPETVTLHPMHRRELPKKNIQWHRLRHIRRVINEVKPDIVIAFLTKINTLTLLATIGKKTPVVISERNNMRAQTVHPLWRNLQHMLAKRANAIIMQTKRAREDLPEVLKSKAEVIANPCAPILDPQKFLDRNVKQLVAVGRLEHQKGFDLLMKAMARIRQQLPDVRLTIYGEGSQRLALEKLRGELDLTNIVSMPGVSKRPGKWMENADALMFPSRFEGFPNVLAEATVCGLPVVSADCAYGPRELIRDGENGLLVPPGDVEALAAAIVRLTSDPDLRKQMRASSSFNYKWLSPGNIMGRWDKVIERVAPK